jgi:hypothetical protein
VGYVFDVAPSFGEGMNTIGNFFANQNFAVGFSQIADLGLGYKDYIVLLTGAAIMFFVSVLQERHPDRSLRAQVDKKPFILRFLLLYFGILAVVVFGVYGSGYNAASFVYMQF